MNTAKYKHNENFGCMTRVRDAYVTVRVSEDRVIRNLSSSLVSNPEVIISTSRMYLDISGEIQIDSLFEWMGGADTSCQSR